MTDSSSIPFEPDMIDVHELAQQVQLAEEMIRLKKENGLSFYNPHKKQDIFHSHGFAKRRYVRCGNRWGKTTAGTAEDLAWCMGERIWYPESDPRRYLGIPKRSVKGVLICQDWDKAEELFTQQAEGRSLGKIWELLPKDSQVGVGKTKSGSVDKIYIRSKWGGISVLYIDTVRSFMTNEMGHESSSWDFVHIDEPCPQGMWAAYARGLIDSGGSAWFMLTPLNQLWINEMFVPRGQGRKDFDNGIIFNTEEQHDYFVMTGHSSDNPNNTPEKLNEFMRDVPKSESEARLSGRPKMLSGIIHKDFEPEEHIYTNRPKGWTSDRPPNDWCVRVAIDPHLKLAQAVLMVATSPLGYSYFWTEIFKEYLIPGLCDQMKLELLTVDEKTGRVFQREPYLVLCDPLAWSPNPHTGITLADAFYQHGFQVQPGSKDLREGILKVNWELSRRDESGHPYLMFSSALHETIYEFDQYVFDPKTESPDKRCHDHMMENLRRLVHVGLTYENPNRVIKPVTPYQVDASRLVIPKLSPSSHFTSATPSSRKKLFKHRYQS